MLTERKYFSFTVFNQAIEFQGREFWVLRSPKTQTGVTSVGIFKRFFFIRRLFYVQLQLRVECKCHVIVIVFVNVSKTSFANNVLLYFFKHKLGQDITVIRCSGTKTVFPCIGNSCPRKIHALLNQESESMDIISYTELIL